MSKKLLEEIKDLPIVRRASIIAQALAYRRRPVLEFINYTIEKRVKTISKKLSSKK